MSPPMYSSACVRMIFWQILTRHEDCCTPQGLIAGFIRFSEEGCLCCDQCANDESSLFVIDQHQTSGPTSKSKAVCSTREPRRDEENLLDDIVMSGVRKVLDLRASYPIIYIPGLSESPHSLILGGCGPAAPRNQCLTTLLHVRCLMKALQWHSPPSPSCH